MNTHHKRGYIRLAYVEWAGEPSNGCLTSREDENATISSVHGTGCLNRPRLTLKAGDSRRAVGLSLHWKADEAGF